MKLKLTNKQVEALKERVERAKLWGTETQIGIAREMNISIATLRRYINERERELSRFAANTRYKIKRYESFILRGLCAICKNALKGHPRCKSCKILLHDKNKKCRCGVTHGINNNGYCNECQKPSGF